nr:DUF5626 family protein [Macrococcus sp. 19Msa1099]QYA39030.1 DUF5626 family protein [Macrococcus caseolyticus]QYA77755.1 DUF5626 family protein [Macrococcus caseolyticus]
MLNQKYTPQLKTASFDLTNPNQQSYEYIDKHGKKQKITLSAIDNPLTPVKDPLKTEENKSTIMNYTTGSTMYLPYGSYTRKVTGTSIAVSMGFTAKTYVSKNTANTKITSATNPWGQAWLGSLDTPTLSRPSKKSAKVTSQFTNNVASTTVWVKGTIVENHKLVTTYFL